jgi:hypothetical protein
MAGFSCRPQDGVQHLHQLRVAQPVLDVQAIAAALHHAGVTQGAHLLGNVRLALLRTTRR